MKKIIGVIAIYVVVGIMTLALTSRVERLESREDIVKQNTNIAYNLK